MLSTALAEPTESRCVGGHGGLDARLGATSFASTDESATAISRWRRGRRAGATKGSPSHQTAPEAPLRRRRGASGLLPRPVPARTALSRKGTPLQSCSRSSGGVTRDRRRAARSARQRSAMLGAIEPVERARPGGSVHWSAEIRSDSGGRGDSARRVRTCADSLHRCLLDLNLRLDGVSFRPFRHHRRVSHHRACKWGVTREGDVQGDVGSGGNSWHDGTARRPIPPVRPNNAITRVKASPTGTSGRRGFMVHNH